MLQVAVWIKFGGNENDGCVQSTIYIVSSITMFVDLKENKTTTKFMDLKSILIKTYSSTFTANDMQIYYTIFHKKKI